MGLLGRSSTTRVLVAANLVVVLAMVWFTHRTVLADAWSYIALADGVLHGEHSMWWPLEASFRDTVRTPDLPLLIAGALWLFGTWKAIIGVNVVLYLFARWAMLKVILGGGRMVRVRSVSLCRAIFPFLVVVHGATVRGRYVPRGMWEHRYLLLSMAHHYLQLCRQARYHVPARLQRMRSDAFAHVGHSRFSDVQVTTTSHADRPA